MDQNYKMQSHYFDVKDAEKYGVDGAIMINNFRFWIAKNKANKKHFYDGNYWTYNSVEAFSELFPYWTKAQIRRILNKLIEQGVLGVGNFNKSSYDRTKWYCLNEEIHLSKSTNGNEQNDKPIPDNNSYNNTDNNNNQTTKNAVLTQPPSLDELNNQKEKEEVTTPEPFANAYEPRSGDELKEWYNRYVAYFKNRTSTIQKLCMDNNIRMKDDGTIPKFRKAIKDFLIDRNENPKYDSENNLIKCWENDTHFYNDFRNWLSRNKENYNG